MLALKYFLIPFEAGMIAAVGLFGCDVYVAVWQRLGQFSLRTTAVRHELHGTK